MAANPRTGRLSRLHEAGGALGTLHRQEVPPASLERPVVELTFWGVRGSFPVARPHARFYGGNTPCVGLVAEGHQLILDAGTGIRPLGRKIFEGGRRPEPLTLLVSHPHWDHIQGFPFFQPAYHQEVEIRVVSVRRTEVSLESLFSGQQRGEFFPVPFEALPARIRFLELEEGEVLETGPFQVVTRRLNHPGITSGYRVSAGGRVLAYLCDVGPAQDILVADRLEGEEEEELRRHLESNPIELARGADAVIHDTFFRPEEYAGREHWGHSTVFHAVEVCRRAGARTLFMFHHHPEHPDTRLEQWYREVRDQVEGPDLRLVVARERTTWKLMEGGVEPCG